MLRVLLALTLGLFLSDYGGIDAYGGTPEAAKRPPKPNKPFG